MQLPLGNKPCGKSQDEYILSQDEKARYLLPFDSGITLCPLGEGTLVLGQPVPNLPNSVKSNQLNNWLAITMKKRHIYFAKK